jgi:hypothetical protein
MLSYLLAHCEAAYTDMHRVFRPCCLAEFLHWLYDRWAASARHEWLADCTVHPSGKVCQHPCFLGGLQRTPKQQPLRGAEQCHQRLRPFFAPLLHLCRFLLQAGLPPLPGVQPGTWTSSSTPAAAV